MPTRMKGENLEEEHGEERVRLFFDEKYVVDDEDGEEARKAGKDRFGETAIRSILKIKADETAQVLVQIMRDPTGEICSDFEYQNSEILLDPTNFDVYMCIENMHYEHAGGRRGYSAFFRNFSGKNEGDFAVDYGFNVRISILLCDNP